MVEAIPKFDLILNFCYLWVGGSLDVFIHGQVNLTCVFTKLNICYVTFILSEFNLFRPFLAHGSTG